MRDALVPDAMLVAREAIANSTALLLAVGLMLDHVGRQDAARRLRTAIDRTINQDKIRTGDLGGGASTHAFAEAVARRV